MNPVAQQPGTTPDQRFFDIAQPLLARRDALDVNDLKRLTQSLFQLNMGAQAVPHVLRLAELQEKAGQHDEALQTLQQGINHDPTNYVLFYHAGLFQHRLGRLADAQRCIERALQLNPLHTPLYNELGVIQQDRGSYNESITTLRKAIKREPRLAQAWLNLGTAYMHLDNAAEAETCYEQALALNPGYIHARSNLGMCQLWQGKLHSGWANYEARYDMPPHLQRVKPPTFPVPRWRGESLVDKRVLVWPEQGLGDQMMCAAWLAHLKEHAQIKQLVLACSRPLLSVFSRLEGPDLLVDVYDAMPLCDVWLGAMSVPNALLQHVHTSQQVSQSEIDSWLTQLPAWLKSDQRWLPDTLQQPTDKTRIGLCWKGSASYPGDARRSFGLKTYNPLLMQLHTEFVTLLPGTRDEFLQWAGNQALDIGHEIDSNCPAFEETAAMINALDLIITSDTSIAHLAVALGKPTWLMLQFAGEWRWSVHPARQSGQLHIFQQPSPGDWSAVVQAVTERLSAGL